MTWSCRALLVGLWCQLDTVVGFDWDANKFVISIEVKLDSDAAIWLNYCVDVAGESTENGTPVQLWECVGNKGQEWIFHDGKLKSAVSGKCLDAGDMTVGSQLMIWDCIDLPQQQWGYSQDAVGIGFQYSIYLASNEFDASLCLGVEAESWQEVGAGNADGNGSPVQVTECQQLPSQLWYGFEHAVRPFEDIYATLTVKGHEDFCLDLAGQSTDNGTPVQIWTCDESGIAGQRWFLTQRGQIRSGVDGTKCLNVDESTKLMHLWDCAADSDRWAVVSSYYGTDGWNEPGCQQSESYTESCHLSVYKQFHVIGPQADMCMRVVDEVYSDGSRVELAGCTCGSAGPTIFCPPQDAFAFRNLNELEFGVQPRPVSV